MDGFNAAVLAYGQTGSGKTHTMSGPGGGSWNSNREVICAASAGDDNRGVNQRALASLFEIAAEREEEWAYDIKVARLEEITPFYCISFFPALIRFAWILVCSPYFLRFRPWRSTTSAFETSFSLTGEEATGAHLIRWMSYPPPPHPCAHQGSPWFPGLCASPFPPLRMLQVRTG